MGPGVVLAKFFGSKPAIQNADAELSAEEFKKLPYYRKIAIGGLKGFAAETAALSEAEKLELARLAAAELGLKQEDVSFPLADSEKA